MAYEPTKNFRQVVRQLVPGDEVISCGSYKKGSINLEGYNIIGRSGGCILDSDGSSLIGNSSAPIDPLLKPLDLDGYVIPTHGLLNDSPAINGGNPAGCKDILNLPIPLDQRGEPRPFGPVCDIGSVEAQFTPVKNIFLPLITR